MKTGDPQGSAGSNPAPSAILASCGISEDFKASSQNLGHEEVLTTFYSYGQVGIRRQGEIIHGLAEPRRPERGNVEKIVEAVVRGLRKSGAVG